jgi:glutathione peroxidase
MLSHMKRWLGIAGLLSLGVVPSAAAAACPALLDHSFPSLLDGKQQSLCQYQGKVILVVNTASFCGFTAQYEGLEKLYAQLKDRGLVVVGFPSNDFGEQEPGSDQQIADFCRLTYGVDFPMMGKTVVKGAEANAFYQQLARITGSQPRWNFHKYLINRDATQVVAYSSATKPEDVDLQKKIEDFLR